MSPGLCITLKVNMKKRLLYAIPRVPLHKQKDIPDNQAYTQQGESHVGTMTKKIVEARKGKQRRKEPSRVPLGGDIELTLSDEDDGTDDEDDISLLGAAAPIHQGESFEKNVGQELFQFSTEEDQTDDPDLDEEEEQLVRRLQEKLQRRNKAI